jgi:hypothetical protein
MSRPRRWLNALTQQRAAPQPGAAPGAGAAGPPDSKPAGRDAIGLLLTAIGTTTLLVPRLLSNAMPETILLAVTWAMLIAGTIGVFRLSAALGHGTALSIMFAAVAILPVMGSVVCGVQLFRALRAGAANQA